MAVNEIEVLSSVGHTTIKWDPKKRSEVLKAHKEFDAMLKAGFQVFTTPKGKKAPVQLEKWDAKVGMVRVEAFGKVGKKSVAMRPSGGG